MDESSYKWCVIYKRHCSSGSRYIGETICNAKVRWNKHVNPTKSSKQPKHLRKNIELCFKWTVISNAPKKTKIGKNFKASYILFCGFLILINKRTL